MRTNHHSRGDMKSRGLTALTAVLAVAGVCVPPPPSPRISNALLPLDLTGNRKRGQVVAPVELHNPPGSCPTAWREARRERRKARKALRARRGRGFAS